MDSADSSIADMVGFSTVFVEEARPLTAPASMGGWTNTLTIAKKDTCRELVASLIEFFLRQHTWLCLHHGIVSLKSRNTDCQS